MTQPPHSGQQTSIPTSQQAVPTQHSMRTRQQRTTSNTLSGGAVEAYPDPSRDWKRSGALIAGWVVTLAAVAGAGLGLEAVGEATAPDLSREAVDDRTAVWIMFNSIYDNPDITMSRNYLCSGYVGPDVESLLSELPNGPYENDIDIDGAEGSGSFTVKVRLFGGAPFKNREYSVLAVSDGSSSCISSITRIGE